MNSKQKKVFRTVFQDPVRSNILWSDIESLFLTCGAEINERNGSRVGVCLNNILATFHRPHLHPVTNKGAVKSVRRFLLNAGVNL